MGIEPLLSTRAGLGRGPDERRVRAEARQDAALGPVALSVDAMATGLVLLAGLASASRDELGWLAWLQLLVLSPILEEIIFRAGLQETLLRRAWSPRASTVVTALAFGAAHALVAGQLQALLTVLPALLLGGLYARGRRLWPCVALHAAMNAIWLGWVLPWLPRLPGLAFG